ncbi:MAG TPA: hypothetical protein VF345_08590 [Chthoniobacterales bacterium]
MGLFLPEEITAPEPPMRMGAAAVDLNLGSLVAPAIDLNEGILAVTDNFNPARFAAIVIDLNEGILAVADNFNPVRFAAIANDLNPGILAATSVDLNARSLFSWRAIVPGYLRRATRDDQSGERDKDASGSRAGRWARRGHRGAKDAETVSPWQA